ncbi:MAG: hypothetical protein LQ346_001316 [Caloplaca aetnensis]|nr:MAG: hypothetical protein LQ346_001316 [Caloplaca aetnensis]
MEVDENSHVCSVCHESKDLSRARFAHVRLGLDDPPEPVLYKCKDSTSIINSIQDKIAKTEETQDWVTSTTMDSLADINVNAALIDSVSGKRVREVELRINTHLPKSMFKKMEQDEHEREGEEEVDRGGGLEGHEKQDHDCAWVLVGDVGKIMHPQYDVDITEIRPVIKIASEFEIKGRVTNSIVRLVLCFALNLVGTIPTMQNDFVRSSDHYEGEFMAKADGVKVYVFCYEFGYIVTITDPALTLVLCMVSIT